MPLDKDNGALLGERLEEILSSYEGNPTNPIVRRALSRTSLSDAAYDPACEALSTPHFSVHVKTMPVTNQKSSGRCWIFAGLNILREIVAKKLGVKEFELSQNYISLYDKIEKANYALESVIALAEEEPSSRVLMHILSCPVSDGGQWDMFVNLVAKYGLLPKDAFPETYQSNATREGNFLVNAAIRDFAKQAHALAISGKKEEIRPLKEKLIAKIYAFFLNSFGVPPKQFDLQYEDKDGKYHIERDLTPKSFFEKYVGDAIYAYQSLINSPTADKPFLRAYTVDWLGNVIEGKPINHLNVSMERMEEAIIAQLQDGEPVWFGSDVAFFRDRSSHSWNSRSFDYLDSYGLDIAFDKAGMLDYRHSAMNHAMVIVGVDLVDGKPRKWKIENSWGSEGGIKGYYVMDEEWFARFVYQAVVDRKYLTGEEVEAAKSEPIHLDPWDPMGTLAD